MKIHGFQKMTMLDYPEKVACTVFLAGCNYRCPFCHNALLVTDIDNEQVWEEDEILSYLYKRGNLLDGVCITGGEPLMQPELEAFIRKIKDLGLAVKLDTNGTYPDRLRALIDASLVDYVAMDIKNAKGKYPLTAGVSCAKLSEVEKSVSILMEGKIPFEFRTTVVKGLHETADIAEIGKWIAGAPRYFLQNFVDSGHLIGENMEGHTPEAMAQMLDAVRQYVPNAQIRGI